MEDGYEVHWALEGEAHRPPDPLVPPSAPTTPKPNYRLAICWDNARRGSKQAEPMEPAASVHRDIIARL
jgi:hypothetical protein